MTVSCAEGDTGFVYDGIWNSPSNPRAGVMPAIPVKSMVNIGTPTRRCVLPASERRRQGLARLDIINRQIGIHPKASSTSTASRDRLGPDRRAGRRLPSPGTSSPGSPKGWPCWRRRSPRTGDRTDVGLQVQ